MINRERNIASAELKTCHKFQLVRGSPVDYLQSVEEFLEPPTQTHPVGEGVGGVGGRERKI